MKFFLLLNILFLSFSSSETFTFNKYSKKIKCIDHGKWQKYCPNKLNDKYFPPQFKYNTITNEITPKRYYDIFNNTQINFKTQIIYDDQQYPHVRGVIVNIYPSKRYDQNPLSELFLELFLIITLLFIFGPFAAIILMLIFCLFGVNNFDSNLNHGGWD